MWQQILWHLVTALMAFVNYTNCVEKCDRQGLHDSSIRWHGDRSTTKYIHYLFRMCAQRVALILFSMTNKHTALPSSCPWTTFYNRIKLLTTTIIKMVSLNETFDYKVILFLVSTLLFTKIIVISYIKLISLAKSREAFSSFEILIVNKTICILSSRWRILLLEHCCLECARVSSSIHSMPSAHHHSLHKLLSITGNNFMKLMK